MPSFAELQKFAKQVARMTAATPERQLESYQEPYQETYEEPYLFGFLSRTRTRPATRTKTRVVRRYWTLGLLYRHVESAYERRRPQSGYRYETEQELVLDAEGDLLVREHKTSGGTSFEAATESDAAQLDRELRRSSNSRRNHYMQEEEIEDTRSGNAGHTEYLAGAREALRRLQVGCRAELTDG